MFSEKKRVTDTNGDMPIVENRDEIALIFPETTIGSRLSDQIASRLNSLDDAFHARVDAEVARRLAEGEAVDWSRFSFPADDPLGYEWCEPDVRIQPVNLPVFPYNES